MASTMNRNISVVKDEYSIFGKALPYVAMLIGGALLFLLGVITRLGMYAQYKISHTPLHDSSTIITWVIVVSCAILAPFAYKLFHQRAAKLKEIGIAWHATITTIVAHLWLILALWDNTGHVMFGGVTLNVYFFGALIVTISWCLRRWSYRGSESTEHTVNPFEEVGLGKNTYLDSRNSGLIPSGRKFRLNLELGKSVENAKNARVAIAQMLKKPRNLVHIRETDSGVEGEVDILVMDADPFKVHTPWKVDNPGGSIADSISYATYDDGSRPNLYLAGKNGNSCQHFLTMGMPGAGKSKAWQAIYGSVLNRSEVAVVFGDPAKGMQTAGALASGLEWFEFTEEGCLEQIAAIMRAIPERADYLTRKGLSHWIPGCGLTFIIFHLEEAARFAEVDELIKLLEAARSAGISIVISLQRATADRLKTSARYNLGGSMCFGVRDKRDAALGLSEGTRSDGAEPHRWQDRKPGHHYLEALGIDQRMFAHELETDWVNEKTLEDAVDAGAVYRSALDNVTISVFNESPRYAMYKTEVYSGITSWQKLRRGRNNAPTQELPKAYQSDEVQSSNTTDSDKGALNHTGTPIQPSLFDTETEKVKTSREETLRLAAVKREKLIVVVNDLNDHGVYSFSANDVLSRMDASYDRAWCHRELKLLVKTGMLAYDENTKFYSIVR